MKELTLFSYWNVPLKNYFQLVDKNKSHVLGMNIKENDSKHLSKDKQMLPEFYKIKAKCAK